MCPQALLRDLPGNSLDEAVEAGAGHFNVVRTCSEALLNVAAAAAATTVNNAPTAATFSSAPTSPLKIADAVVPSSQPRTGNGGGDIDEGSGGSDVEGGGGDDGGGSDAWGSVLASASALLELSWEKLHLGYWKDVHVVRTVYDTGTA